MVVEMADPLVASTARMRAVKMVSLMEVHWDCLMVARVAQWAVL